MNKIVAALLLSVSFAVSAAPAMPLPLEQCKDHAPYGFMASKKQDTTPICRIGYVLEHDNKAHIPIWVSYTLSPEDAVGCFPRVGSFVVEPGLPEGASATSKQYAKSGYDIGHMANDGDMRWSAVAEAESNIFANAAPQLPEFNRGIWKKLEDSTRGWVLSRKHTLNVITGPIYDRVQDRTMDGTDVTVPHAFFKVIVDTSTLEVQAFIMKHEGSVESLQTFMTSIAEIQRQTGLVIPLPKKAKISTVLWPVTLKNAVKSKQAVCALNLG